jgi:hypothetical protein
MRCDAAEILRNRLAGELGDGTRHFDARRPAADNYKSEQRMTLVGVGLGLGPLHRHQHLAADCGRVFDCLDPGGKGCPVVAPEIAVACAGGQHQPVIGHRLAVTQYHAFVLGIDTIYPVEHHAGVGVSLNDAANGRGDIGGGEACGCHLIQQWLEEMVIAFVDQRDIDVGVAQALGSRQAAKACANDHNMWARC